MPLSWNEIRSRAATFVNEWRDESYEKGEAQSFWNDFFDVFGLSRRRLASFEQSVKKLSGREGFIDLLWPGVLLVEHKSRGKDLESAEGQALDYFPGLKDEELPRYVLVSDFGRFRLHDLEDDEETEFELEDFLNHVEAFGFLAGYEKRSYDEQDPVNVRAAEKMGALHDLLRDAGYTGHDLEVYLVRLLFCLFADDTGIFTPRGHMEDYLLNHTREDGTDLGPALDQLFYVLNTPQTERQQTLDEDLQELPYVNGQLFEERLAPASFDSDMRDRLLEACALDWGAISPAIFGSLFQSVMDPEARRALGAHYTSEKNILKLIEPLFLDGLRVDLKKAGSNKAALGRFQQRLADLRFLDPACGCGNFLVVAYRELRRLELEVLKRLHRDAIEAGQLESIETLVRVSVEQCFGIEIEEFPAQIAQVALWLVDHQMNLEAANELGQYFTRLPLTQTAHILNDNALRVDWDDCFGDAQPERFDYLLGNPPFGGAKYQSDGQKEDLKAVLHDVKSAGLLDFVTGWYIKAAQYMEIHPETVTAFVSTNSISQGEQVGVLWNELFTRYDARIHFAHRTFQWTSQARGKAAVHCVIIGFALFDVKRKRLFDYQDVRGEPHERSVSTINPYLVDGANVVVLRRSKPLCESPPIGIGNKPIDGGYYLFTPEEKAEFLEKEPGAAPYFRRWMGAQEFLNGVERWCLWLGDATPQELRGLPECMKRIEKVKKYRLKSKSAGTRKLAKTPTRFHVENMPESNFLVVPEVSSQRRDYIPIGYLGAEILASNKLRVVSNATRYDFGILSSAMHMAWMRYTTGRLKSDYQYSITVVYNNFPWPEPTDAQREKVSEAAQAVIDARAPHLEKGATLADLYDPLSMPRELMKAHEALDRAIDRCYRSQAFPDETRRVAHLFERYEELTKPVLASG